MPHDRSRHHRRSIRLRNWDYAASAAYHVVICSYRGECLFGEIIDSQMSLSPYGQIVVEEWERSEEIRREVALDAFVVMPNHFHGIVFIERKEDKNLELGNGDPQGGVDSHAKVGAQGLAPLHTSNDEPRLNVTPKSLGSLMRGFKSAVTTRINQRRDLPGAEVWQRNYYESIIRNERHLWAVRQYVRGNPANWPHDDLHPDNWDGAYPGESAVGQPQESP